MKINPFNNPREIRISLSREFIPVYMYAPIHLYAIYLALANPCLFSVLTLFVETV